MCVVFGLYRFGVLFSCVVFCVFVVQLSCVVFYAFSASFFFFGIALHFVLFCCVCCCFLCCLVELCCAVFVCVCFV